VQKGQVIKLLSEHKAEINTFGVRRLVLFGSVSRDEMHPGSDVDFLVEFERPTGLFGLFSLQDRLEEILGCPVDLGTPESLKDRIRSQILAECIDVTSTLDRTN